MKILLSLGGFAFVIYWIYYFKVMTPQEIQSNGINYILLSLLPAVCLYCVAFVYHFCRAPYLIHLDQSKILDEQNFKLSELLNAKKAPTKWDKWLTRRNNYSIKVKEMLESEKPNLKDYVKLCEETKSFYEGTVLNTMTPLQFLHATKPGHSNNLQDIKTSMYRFIEFIENDKTNGYQLKEFDISILD